MWAAASTRIAAAALVAASFSIGTAGAQITSSGPLRQVDPWGVGWLGRQDGALPATLWDGASALRMDDLMSQIDAAALSPASAELLRRTLSSSGRGPLGADAALTQARLELLRALGEGERAVDLRLRFPEEAWAGDGEAARVDRDLAAGRLGDACAAADATTSEDGFWLQVRTLCFASIGETAASELTLELARSSGVDETWLREAIAAIDAPNGPKPDADYATGLNLEASLLAGLETNPEKLDDAPADLAALLALRADTPDDLRRLAAFNAALAGRLPAETARGVLMAPPPTLDEDLDPDATAPERSALEQAADLFADPLAADDIKAAGLAGVLDVEGQSFASFRLAARLLGPELRATAPNLAARPYAEVFARAALADGDFDSALAWRAAMAPAPPPQPDPIELLDVGLDDTATGAIDLLPASDAQILEDEPAPPVETPEEPFVYSEWTLARMDALLLVAGAGVGVIDAKDTALRLAAHMEDDTRNETLRTLHIFAALGKPLPPEAREILAASAADVGKPIGFGELAAINSAAASGVLGEAVLATIAAIGDDPATVEAGGLGAVISILASAGLEADARALALEALSPHHGF